MSRLTSLSERTISNRGARQTSDQHQEPAPRLAIERFRRRIIVDPLYFAPKGKMWVLFRLRLCLTYCVYSSNVVEVIKIYGRNSDIAKSSSLASLRPLRLLSDLVLEEPGELTISASQSARSKVWRVVGHAAPYEDLASIMHPRLLASDASAGVEVSPCQYSPPPPSYFPLFAPSHLLRQRETDEKRKQTGMSQWGTF